MLTVGGEETVEMTKRLQMQRASQQGESSEGEGGMIRWIRVHSEKAVQSRCLFRVDCG